MFLVFFFFFKQKTAYEMRISDWSSDVCSSDLRPAIALAIRWCEDHLPAPTDPVLVHGDYRMVNIMVDVAKEREGGLAAVLDWELAHLGDGHEDLAFGCMTVWRFGQRSEEHTSELQSLMRISYAVFCLRKKNTC